MIPRYPKRRDIRHRLVKTIERQRKDDISRVAESSDSSSGGGAWCLIEDNRDWVDGAAGFYAQMADMTPFDQSGGFTLVDAQTLALPEGFYMVEWTFSFEFFFVNPYGSGFFGQGWTTWRGGPIIDTGSVRLFNGEYLIEPVQFIDYGGGDASVKNRSSQVFKWVGIVAAGGVYGSNLALGILEFDDFFRSAIDLSTSFTEVGQAATAGSGRQNVWIASVG